MHAKAFPGGTVAFARQMPDEGDPCGVVLRPVSLSFCDVKGRERRSKPVSFSLLEKERFLESKEKGAPVRVEWSQIGIRRPVFTPPIEDQHRPQETPPVEQGQAVVLSDIFSPPAWVGVGAWWRCLVFSLLWGTTTPAGQTTLRSGVGAACGRPLDLVPGRPYP